MEFYANLQTECVGLLGMRNPRLTKAGGRWRATAPFLLDVKPAWIPESAPEAYGADFIDWFEAAKTKMESDPEFLAKVTEVHYHLTAETKPGQRIMKMLLCNRPEYYPGSKISANGDNPSLESPSLSNPNGEGAPSMSQVLHPTAPNDFLLSRVLLEQSLLTAGAIQTRKGGKGQNDITQPRQKGEGPITIASVPSPMMALAMKKGERTRLNCELGGDGTPVGFRTAANDPTDDNIVWADFYNDMGGNTPDGPNGSMLSVKYWAGEGAMIRPYDARGRYDGPYAMSRKRATRDTDFTWEPGDFDDTNHPSLTNLLTEIDNRPQTGWVSLLGDVAAVSNDDTEASPDDKAANETLLRCLAQGPMIKHAIALLYRDIVVSLFLENRKGDIKCGALLSSWWWQGDSSRWEENRLNWFKMLMCFPIVATNPRGGEPEMVPLCDPLFYGTGVSEIVGLTGESIGAKGTSIATTGSLRLRIDNLGKYVVSREMTTWNNTYSCMSTIAHQGYANTSQFTGRTRAFFGKASETGDWVHTAEGRYGGPGTMYDQPAKCRFSHLPFAYNGMPRDSVPTVFGTVYDLTEQEPSHGVWWVTGDACGIHSVGVTALFEDEVSRYAADWDDATSGITLFVTNCQGGY